MLLIKFIDFLLILFKKKYKFICEINYIFYSDLFYISNNLVLQFSTTVKYIYIKITKLQKDPYLLLKQSLLNPFFSYLKVKDLPYTLKQMNTIKYFLFIILYFKI